MEIFKAYDIRGTVPDQLDADLSYRIGRAAARHLEVETVVVGRDAREHSPALRDALGMLAAGERSDFVETPYGLLVVELQERTQAGLKPFEQVRSVIERSLQRLQRDQISVELLAEAGASERIRVNAGLADLLHAELFPKSAQEASTDFDRFQQ